MTRSYYSVLFLVVWTGLATGLHLASDPWDISILVGFCLAALCVGAGARASRSG